MRSNKIIISIVIMLTTIINVAMAQVVTELIITADGKIIVDNENLKNAVKDFKVDWHNAANTAAMQSQVNHIENILSKTQHSQLTSADKVARGKLYYKLGAYYAHVAKNPDIALSKMSAADNLLSDKSEKTWNYAHLAYVYEIKYHKNPRTDYKSQSLTYVDKVIASGTKNSEVLAFSYCVRGMLAKEQKQFAQASSDFKKAISIYQKISPEDISTYIKLQNIFGPKQNATFADRSQNLIIDIYKMFSKDAEGTEYCNKKLS